jgi:hypothetical protein
MNLPAVLFYGPRANYGDLGLNESQHIDEHWESAGREVFSLVVSSTR